MNKVRTCFWFDGQAEEAAEFYVSLLPDSRVNSVFRPDPNGAAVMVDFTLAGTPYQGLNGGPQFPQTEAASIVVLTADQQETDRLWSALTAGGGAESMCGWLKDRFGVSWQIVPEALPALMNSGDPEASRRVMDALMGMQKIDIAALEAAHAGD